MRSEILWLVGSVSVGALLLPRWGLMGFGLGGLFAALAALLYTFTALRRAGLPRPSVRFVAGHAGVGLLLWGVTAALAWRHPWDSPIPVALAGLVIALLFGLLLGRGGFFTGRERERLAALAGAGWPGHLVTFFLGPPRVVDRTPSP